MNKSNIDNIVRYALEQGAYKALLLDSEDIVVDERVRLKCIAPVCPNYNKRMLCPPRGFSFEECRKIIKRYSHVLILQIQSKMDMSVRGGEELQQALRDSCHVLHELIQKVESYAISQGYHLAAGIGAEPCSLCDECVAVKAGVGCVHPFEARPDLTQLCIDITTTLNNCGLSMKGTGTDLIVWTGLVFID